MSLETEVTKALNDAFRMGMTYWQQADSESPKQWVKADTTRECFQKLVRETQALFASAEKGE